MGKKIINAMNAGELSPYLYARTDFDKYDSGCLVMENFVPLPYGGVTRRPAIEYLGEASDSDADGADDKIRLVPFTASVDASYILEFGDGYIKVWKNDGTRVQDGVSDLEIGSPYAEGDLPNLKFAQSVDVMWVVDGNNPVQRISRLSETSWTITEEDFLYPPFMEENTTDIRIWSSAATGSVTLTSDQDFFDSGHVGTSFLFKSKRRISNATISGSFTTSSISSPLYVSNADWEFSTTGTFKGRCVLQRSTDNKVTWEDYIIIGDTRSVATGGEKNFIASSDEKEPTGVWVRLMYIHSSGTCSFQIKTSDDWFTHVEITGYTSATSVSATVVDQFQYIPSDFTNWTVSTGYSVGDLVRVGDAFTYDSVSTDLEAINSELTHLVGADYGGGYFWCVTDTGSVRKIWKLDAALTAVESGFPVTITSDFTVSVGDIAWYLDNLYVVGNTDTAVVRIKKYDETGTFLSTFYSLGGAGTRSGTGLGYHSGFFYMGHNTTDSGATSYLKKINTSGVYGGVEASATGDDSFSDITGFGTSLYATNNTLNTVRKYNTSLTLLTSASVSSQTTLPKGIANDGTNIWVFGDDGSSVMKAWKYTISEDEMYYECVKAHTSGSAFATNYALGYWAVRDPKITTWTEGAFSGYRGHPKVVSLFEGRLCYAGTDANPDTVWLSKVENYTYFRVGTLDTDAMKLSLGGGQLDEVQWLIPQEVLIIGCSGSEWALGPSDEAKPITPSGYNLKQKSTYGSSTIQGLLVNNAVIFPMRQGRKVREWFYDWGTQKEPATDLTILSEHITIGGITQWAFQQQPDNIIWAIRSDGELLGFTYERDQNVVGWHRHNNDQFIFESVSVIPKALEEDEVWVSVKITVNGSVKRYIGRLIDREWGTDHTTQWRGSDLFTVYSSPATATLTGLDYLEGETVSVVADGVPKDNEVVSSGSITVDSDAYTTVVVGLPFTATVAPMYLHDENQFGSSQGSFVDVSKAIIRFKDTYSAKVGQTATDTQSVRWHPDESLLHNDEGEAYFDNASDFLRTCYIVNDEQMPCTVLAMIPKIGVRR